MKKDWKLYDRLMRIESELGWDPVRKTIDAMPEWWDEKIETDPELVKFRGKNLEMYHMFYDQLFQVGAANIEGNEDSDEFSLDDSVEISFPESSSTKKKKKKENNSNTLSKRGKTTGVSSSFELKLDTVLQTLSSRISQTCPQQNHVPSISECMDIVATFPGFEPRSTNYNKALRIFWKKEARESFMYPPSSLDKINFLMYLNSDDEKNDSNEEDWMEDENTYLKEHYDLKATRNVSIEESVGVFLFIFAHGCGNRLAQETFNHFGETIHWHFHKVLKAVLKLSGDIIKPNANYTEEVPPQILNNSCYYPTFKALDFRNLRRKARLLIRAYQISSTNSNKWDTVQLETAVNTISHEYLLDFTSEYGIPETLHPALPGPEDRIVDFPEGKVGVYTRTNCRPLTEDIDLFNLIRAPNPTKVKTGSRPRAPHEVPLLTLSAPRVIEMDEPAATDSSGVSSTIERSPLDFAHEAGASDQGATAPEMPSSEDVPATAAPGAGQAEETAMMDPPATPESRSSHGGKSLAAIQLGLASTVVVPEDAPVGVSDPDPLSFADAPSRHPIDVAQSSPSIAAAGDPESENVSSPAEVGSPGSVYQPEWGVTNGGNGITAALEIQAGGKAAEEVRGSDLQVSNERLSQQVATLQQQVSGEEKLKAAFEEFKRQQDERVEQRCAEMDARLDALSIDFDEEIYPHMLTAIAGRRWVIGRGLRLAVMKCGESLELRQAFADAVSVGIAKGLSEGLRHGLEHGQAQRSLESIEAYDPKAEAKFVTALQALKDLKYPLVDQLEGLRDAPMDVIMAALNLESDTGDDASQDICDLRPISSQLTIPVYPEVRDPRNPWACKEEIRSADAIAANISRAEKKKRCRIVCRTYGVSSEHHARSDGVPVSAPTVVPQGLALLLVDAATQTESDDT
uniref:DUF8040 domain-containing protein n=1 Tax=Tanacetum cinerariifolium TaxID=118510 RepID=A0A6L2JYN5_TANCI|nr:hypothetical protein [Tanacetum cinerariifolium]